MTPIRFLVLIISLGATAGAHAALVDRGGGLIYDTTLNVTWLQDVNYARTTGYDADGRMTWYEAQSFAATATYFDAVRGRTWTDWRLPNAAPVDGLALDFNSGAFDGTGDLGYNITRPTSELSYMFYGNLGNTGRFDSDGNRTGCGGVVPAQPTCLTNVGPFVNLAPLAPLPDELSLFWYRNLVSAENDFREPLAYRMSAGAQIVVDDHSRQYAWLVRDGDVPEPATLALLSLGLAGLAVGRRRRHC